MVLSMAENESVTERQLRDALGDNPDTSKSLRQ